MVNQSFLNLLRILHSTLLLAEHYGNATEHGPVLHDLTTLSRAQLWSLRLEKSTEHETEGIEHELWNRH
jgi:hypothetical protein